MSEPQESYSSEKKEQEKIKKIREYLKKSGFPLEVEIGNILRKNGWLVGNQWPYIDKDADKIRAADILAIKISPTPQIAFLLLIECKKSLKHDWLFYTQEKQRELLPLIWSFVDIVKKFEHLSNRFRNLTANQIASSKLLNFHLLDNTIKVGVFNVLPSPKERDDFFVATNELISALAGMRDRLKSTITFPIIVFDGDIFEFYQKGDETEILPIDHLQFISFEKAQARTRPCLVDVVKKTYFPEFLKMIEQDISIIKEVISTGGGIR